jgi:hypothetical protein
MRSLFQSGLGRERAGWDCLPTGPNRHLPDRRSQDPPAEWRRTPALVLAGQGEGRDRPRRAEAEVGGRRSLPVACQSEDWSSLDPTSPQAFEGP